MKATFYLNKLEDGSYYWTNILPEQRKKFSSRAEAVSSLASIITRLKEGRFDVVEVDLANGSKETDFKGGILQLVYVARKDNLKAAKRVSAKKRGKSKLRRASKRNRR